MRNFSPLVALAAVAVGALGCTLSFDRDYAPGDGSVDGAVDGAVDGSIPTRDAGPGPCEGAADGEACPGGRCVAGACCTGCRDGAGCVAGDDATACGEGGEVCAACGGDRPSCEVGQCRAEHAAAEVVVGHSHFCARDLLGAVFCWGSDRRGQLGVRPPGGACRSDAPLRVPLPGPARQIAATEHTTCAVLEDGAGLCWGALGTETPAPPCDDGAGMVARDGPAILDPLAILPADGTLRWRELRAGRELVVGVDEDGAAWWAGDWSGVVPVLNPAAPVLALDGVRVDRLVLTDRVGLALRDDGAPVYLRGTADVVELVTGEAPSAIGAGFSRRCLAYGPGPLADRIECIGMSLPDVVGAFEAGRDLGGAMSGYLARRSDAGRVTSVTAFTYGGDEYVFWVNDASELWTLTDLAADPSPERLILGGVEGEIAVVVSGRNGHLAALDAAGRVWTWPRNEHLRATLVALP